MKNKLFLFLFLFYTLGTKASKNDDFSMIMEKIVQSNTIVCSDSIVDTIIPLFQSDGSFSDIDYSLRDRTVWPPIEHLDRLLAMAYSYVEKGRKYYGNHAFFERIQIGLHFWYDNNPISDNRWWWLISEPQKLGLLLMVLDGGIEKISPELIDAIIQRWEERGGNPERESGGNQVDVALHTMYRACLIRDEVLLNRAIYYIFESIKYVIEDDGIRFDNSYMAHGNQLHIGGYGETQLYGQTPVAYYLQGTKFQLENEKIALLSKYIMETFIPCIRGQVMSYNAHGRGISRKDYLKRIDRWNIIINSWKYVDFEHKSYYDSFLYRINDLSNSSLADISLNTIYYQGDYLLHVRPNYSFTVRLSSDRSIRNEYGNDEGLKGYFISDGSTCLQINGKEYENIMPLWDWNYIPGITAPVLESVPLPAKEWGVPGTSSFCGGASDGNYGIVAYSYYDDYNNINTGALKSWFCFDDAIVCLGADIKSSYNKVYTSIEQNWGDKSFDVLLNDGQWISTKDISSSNIICVHHGNTAYFFPDGGHVIGSLYNAEGNWWDINKSEKNEVVKGEVFKLLVENELDISNRYCYILLPNIPKSDCLNILKNLSIDILQNNDSIQAVYDSQKQIYEIVFFTGATFIHGNMTLKVSQPCTMILKRMANYHVIYISDPSHKLENVHFVCKYLNGESVSKIVELPVEEEYKGKTVEVHVEMPNIVTINSLKEDGDYGVSSLYDVSGRAIHVDKSNCETWNNLTPGFYIKVNKIGKQSVSQKVIVR